MSVYICVLYIYRSSTDSDTSPELNTLSMRSQELNLESLIFKQNIMYLINIVFFIALGQTRIAITIIVKCTTSFLRKLC